jgi:hypothetical protein
MKQPRGRTLPLSLPRRLIVDLMHFSQQVPAVSMERRMHLGALASGRLAATPRPGRSRVP